MIPIVGAVYFIVYFFLFRFMIRKYNYITPGREEDGGETKLYTRADYNEKKGGNAENDFNETSRLILEGLGGKDNIKVCGACATRLRLEVADPQRVDEQKLKALGARGVIKTQMGSVQVVIGTDVEMLLDEMKPYLN